MAEAASSSSTTTSWSMPSFGPPSRRAATRSTRRSTPCRRRGRRDRSSRPWAPRGGVRSRSPRARRVRARHGGRLDVV